MGDKWSTMWKMNLSFQSRDHFLDLFEGETSITIVVDLFEEMYQ